MSADSALEFFSPSLDLIREYGASLTDGLRVGENVHVPLGWVGIVILTNGKVMDSLKPGDHVVHPANLPVLARYAKVGTELGSPVGACVLLVNCSLQELGWSGEVALSRGRRHGLTAGTASGHCSFRVTDPERFLRTRLAEAQELSKHASAALVEQYPAFGRAGSADLAVARTCLPEIAGWLVNESIRGFAEDTFLAAGLAPEETVRPPEELAARVEENVRHSLKAAGIEMFAFRLDGVEGAVHCACTRCGSESAPTAYATFNRNISLFYLRFQSQEAGNYCTGCALLVGFTHNLIMLFVGWWGIIGALLTPVFLIGNTYQMLSVAFGRKRAARDPIRPAGGGW